MGTTAVAVADAALISADGPSECVVEGGRKAELRYTASDGEVDQLEQGGYTLSTE